MAKQRSAYILLIEYLDPTKNTRVEVFADQDNLDDGEKFLLWDIYAAVPGVREQTLDQLRFWYKQDFERHTIPGDIVYVAGSTFIQKWR